MLCAVIRLDHCKFASYGPAVLVEEATIGEKLQLDLCSFMWFHEVTCVLLSDMDNYDTINQAHVTLTVFPLVSADLAGD